MKLAWPEQIIGHTGSQLLFALVICLLLNLKQMKKILYITTLLYILPLFPRAQVKKTGIPEITYFNRRQYNGATQNWAVTQNNTGFLYFANNDGILEYDGERWRLLNQMKEYVIRSVKAIDNKIYAGSFSEIGCFEYNKNNQLEYNRLYKDDQLEYFREIWNIHQWNDKVIFQSERGIGIFKNHEMIQMIKAPSRFVSCFVVQGMVLLQDEKQGLMELRGNQVFPIQDGKIFTSKNISTIIPLADNRIMIGTVKNGLFIWNMQTITSWNTPSNNLLKETNIFCGTRYDKDLIALGTIQGGFVIIDNNGEVYMQINEDKGLKNNTVLSMTVDNEGNIWGGLDNGIVKVKLNSSITYLQNYYDLGTGYACTKQNDQYYFGTNQSLYAITNTMLYNPLKTENDFKRIQGTEGQVWSLYGDGSHLLCGHNNGAFLINNNKAKLITPMGINGVWNFKPVPQHPELLISGTYNGLILFEKKANQWQYKQKLDSFNVSSRFIEWDSKHHLWISHGYKGVYRLSFNKDFNHITKIDTFSNDSFPENHSSLVLSKINGHNAFTSLNGVYRYSYQEEQFVKDHQLDIYFTPGNFPTYIIEDQYQNLWCFYDKHLAVLRYLEDGTYKKIEYPLLPLDRKLVNSFESIYVVDENNIFVGIEDGFAHYSNEALKNYKTPFRAHIRSFIGHGDTTQYQLNHWCDTLTQPAIPEFMFEKNTFHIEFAASEYSTNNILYSTYLKGYDNTPSEWGKDNVKNYTNLPEGQYTFVMKAKNTYDIESAPVSFSFIVLPPWYRSLKAKIGFTILLVLLTIALLLLFNRRMELNRQKEKLQQQEKFKQKEEKLKTAALISEKEMINLRNEKLKNEMIYKEKELANSTVNLIQKNDFLNDLKIQLKRLSKINDKKELETKVRMLIKKIDKDIDNENHWNVFEMHFDQVHESFFHILKQQHPELSNREQKLCAFIKMGMSSKEIASIMNISTRAVENNRYKLRLKLGLRQGENLLKYIEQLAA